MRRQAVAAGVVAALVLTGLVGATAYAAREPGPFPDPGPPPRGSADLPTVEIHDAGGGLELALYADGRVYTPGASVLFGPGTSMSGPTQTRQKRPEQTERWRADLSRWVTDGFHARLTGGRAEGTEIVTVRTADGVRTARYEWGAGGRVPEAAKQLAKVEKRVVEKAAYWSHIDPTFPAPAGFEVRVKEVRSIPAERVDDPSAEDWPGGRLEPVVGRCSVERDVQAVYPVLRATGFGTSWDSGGHRFRLQVRPLAPGETACR